MEDYTALKKNIKAKTKNYYQVFKEKIQKRLLEYYRNLSEEKKFNKKKKLSYHWK